MLVEVLDHLLCGLSPQVHAQILVHNLHDFEHSALVVERVAGAHREVLQGGGTGADPVPIDLGAIRGSSIQGSSDHSSSSVSSQRE